MTVSTLDGKIALVTGGTNGIGKVTAQELARRGAEVTIVGRNPDKTRRVADEIGASYLLADLSELAQVRRVAAAFRDTHGRLDLLINNAGAVFARRQESAEGIEMTLALNHLSPFLLTRELEELLHAAPGARVINVSSEAHRTRMNWPDLEFRARYAPWWAYGQSKLANILFTRELARRWRGRPVTVNALHPGFVASGFGRGEAGALSRMMGLAHRFAISEEEGARTTLFLAGSPQVAGVSGRYFVKAQEAAPAPQALDDAAAARLWQLSEELVKAALG